MLILVNLLVHTLFYEALGIQLFSDLDTEFEVFAHEGFKTFGPQRLPLFLIEHIIVVFDNFLNGLPILLDHARCCLSTFFHLMFHIFSFPFLLEFFLMQLFPACAYILFCITDLLLSLPLEVLRHPFHLLDQEIPMSFLRRLSRYRYLPLISNHSSFHAWYTSSNRVLELGELSLEILPL